MKRFFISLLLIFSLLGLKGNAFAQANYINGNSLTKDPVWGSSYYRYADGGDDVVTTEAELWAAITAAAANEPHIIPIATGITLSATITIPAAKNIVLRKVVVENSEPEKGSYYRAANGKYIVQKWWNFGNPWVNTNAASPDLYDGEPDYFITQPQTATFRHIIVSGSDVTLTLENITLQGNNPNTDVSVLDRAKTSPVTGGILVNETNFVFRGFIDKCADIKYEYIGPAICIAGNSNLNFKMLGGVISGCLSNIGGAIGFTQNTNNAYSIHTPNGGYTFQITGYTIIENCAAMEYGGAICFIGGTLELSGSTIIRNCKGRFGGAILFRNGGTAEIKDNVRIENCLSLAYEPKPRGNAGYSGLGGAFVTFGTPIINVRDNATFANNRAMRGGGAFFLQTKAAELNLYGGVFTGNEATGEYRELASTDAEVIRYSIGGGGAIYAFDPKVVKIPANSTVYFSGNKASSAAYIDNTALQKLLTGSSFFDNDNYISHIQNANIHTSLVNAHGPSGSDFYNLYNNYDIGVPNNLNMLYADVTVNMKPEHGGGNILPDAGNLIISQGGAHSWATVGAKLKYTAQANAGYLFEKWALSFSGNPLQSEIAALLGLPDSATSAKIAAKLEAPELALNIQAFNLTATALFREETRLTLATPTIPGQQATSASQYVQPAWGKLTITAGGYYTAEITKVEITGSDKPYFELHGGLGANHTSSVLTGSADSVTWQVRPVAALPLLKTYTAQVKVTYLASPSGAKKTVEQAVHFSLMQEPFMDVTTSPIDFGTGVEGSLGSLSLPLKIHNDGVDAGVVTDLSFTAAGGAPSTSFTASVSAGGGIPVANNATTELCRISPSPSLAAGDYHDTLKITYGGSNLNSTRTLSVPVSITVRTPAMLTIANPLNAKGRIALSSVRQGYVLHPSQVMLLLQNSGQTAATVTEVALRGGAGSSFRIATGSLGGDVPSGGSNGNFSVDIVDGLTAENATTAKTYTDAITVTYSDGIGSPKSVSVGVEVTVMPRLIWSFALDGASYTYPAMCISETPSSKSVAVTNTGNMPLGGMKISFASGGANFALSKATLTDADFTGKTATFTVTPATKLAVGSYSASVRVEFDMSGVSNADCSANADCEYNQKDGRYYLYALQLEVVNPPSFTLTAQPLAVCKGESVTLSDAIGNLSVGATMAYYAIPDGSTGKLPSATVAPASSASYYARATLGSCQSQAKKIQVTVHEPVLTLKGSWADIAVTCKDTALDLSTLTESVSSGGAIKAYSNAACTEKIGITGKATIRRAGTYYLRAEDAATGCVSAPQEVAVTEKATVKITAQPIKDTAVYQGNMVNLTVGAAGHNGGVQYQWYSVNGGAVSGENKPTYTPSVATPGASAYYAEAIGVCGDTARSDAAALSVLARLEIAGAAIAKKTYDKTGEASVTEISFGNAYTKNPVTLTLGDDYTAAAQYADGAAAGLPGRAVKFTVHLTDAARASFYALPDSVKTITATGNEYAIHPRPLTVTPVAGQRKFYRAPDPALAFTTGGWIAGDYADSSAIITGALSREAGEDAGNYEITNVGASPVATVSGSSYFIDAVAPNVMFTIVQAALDGAVTISGVDTVGSTLTAVTNMLVSNPLNAPFGDTTYQWKRNGVAITGATGKTYTLVQADTNATITVTVRAENLLDSVDSDSKGPIKKALLRGAVTISGVDTVGSTLTAVTDALDSSPLNARFGDTTYQWKRNGVAIAGATGKTYTLVQADTNATITVTVWTENLLDSVDSDSKGPIKKALLRGAVTISGVDTVGNTLTAVTDALVSSPLNVNFGDTTYQWKRNGVAIASATGKTYTLVQADTNATITVTVWAENLLDSVDSDSKGPIKKALLRGAVTISGVDTVGNTLTAVTDALVSSPLNVNFGDTTYQWKRNGVAIANATGKTYTLVQADTNATITVTVWAENLLDSADSDSKGPIKKALLQRFTIRFISNGNDVEEYRQVAVEGDRIAEPLPEPILARHTFKGWYYDDGTDEYRWNFAHDKVAKDMTLYAKWQLDSIAINGVLQKLAGDTIYYAMPCSGVRDQVEVQSGDTLLVIPTPRPVRLDTAIFLPSGGQRKRYTLTVERPFVLSSILHVQLDGKLLMLVKNPAHNGGFDLQEAAWERKVEGHWELTGNRNFYYASSSGKAITDTLRVLLREAGSKIWLETCPYLPPVASAPEEDAHGLVYPNPVAVGGTVKLKEDMLVGGIEEHYSTYHLVDVYGQTLSSGNAAVLTQGLTMPNMPGVYYLILDGKAGRKQVKIAVGKGS